MLNRQFQGMRKTMVTYCPEAVNTLLGCKTLRGRLVSVTRQGKDQLGKQKSRGSTQRARNTLTPSNTRLVSPEAGQTLLRRARTLQRAVALGRAHCPPGDRPCVLVGDMVARGDPPGGVSGLCLLPAPACLSSAVMEAYIWPKNSSRVACYMCSTPTTSEVKYYN